MFGNDFESSLLSSPSLHLFDDRYLMKNTVKKKQHEIFTFYVIYNFEYILKCNLLSKAKFSASLLQSSVSHDPSEITLICWFAAQETGYYIYNYYNILNSILIITV